MSELVGVLIVIGLFLLAWAIGYILRDVLNAFGVEAGPHRGSQPTGELSCRQCGNIWYSHPDHPTPRCPCCGSGEVDIVEV